MIIVKSINWQRLLTLHSFTLDLTANSWWIVFCIMTGWKLRAQVYNFIRRNFYWMKWNFKTENFLNGGIFLKCVVQYLSLLTRVLVKNDHRSRNIQDDHKKSRLWRPETKYASYTWRQFILEINKHKIRIIGSGILQVHSS